MILFKTILAKNIRGIKQCNRSVIFGFIIKYQAKPENLMFVIASTVR